MSQLGLRLGQGFRVWGLGFKVYGFGVSGLGLRLAIAPTQ